MTVVDLYALLGVTRAASTAEVERAYRRLARRYHPGVNPGDRLAERLYQQVQEAYAVLANADRRREYDRGMAAPVEDAAPVAFEGFDFSAVADGPLAATFSELFSDVFQRAARQATTPARGLDVLLTLTLPFEDGVRGCQAPLSVTRHERCAACHGQGFLARNVAACAACSGEGTRRWARGHMVFTKSCEACGGNGQSVRELCVMCQGAGVTSRTDVVTISVPAGIESGSRLTVPGYGHAGALGGGAGDLYVTVDVGTHRYFTRRGGDLHFTLPLAIHEAAFGAVIAIGGLEGPLRVRVPQGVRSGSTIVVRGAGGVKPGTADRGDIVATVELTLPRELDARSRDLLREFGRINTGDVRGGMFDQA